LLVLNYLLCNLLIRLCIVLFRGALHVCSSSAPERARFSFMGGPGLGNGPLSRRVTYKLPAPATTSAATAAAGSAVAAAVQPGVLSISSPGSVTKSQQQQQQVVQASVFDYLQAQMQQLRLTPDCAAAAAAELPFNFWGGFVGYLGYELKAECGGANAHAAPGPDAAWLFADRLLVVDHELGDVWLLALAPAAAAGGDSVARGAAAAQQWLDSTAGRVQRLAALRQQQQQQQHRYTQVATAATACQQMQQQIQQQQQQQQQHGCSTAGVHLRHGRDAYVSNVESCKASLVAGDSYELCLTTSYSVNGTQGSTQVRT
jgi:para-aminobenzoate synthetase